MHPALRFVPARPTALLLLALSTAPACLAAEPPRTEREQAVFLYDTRRYDEARPLLEKLVGPDGSDGAMLYRLYYCMQTAGDPEASAMLGRARVRLEEQNGTTDDLEVPFYLVNAYQNLGLQSSARQVAEETTARVEAGEIPEPRDGVEQFRLGKLYGDQARTTEAVSWYERAVAELSRSPERYASYLGWAGRALAAPAFSRGDWAAAAQHYAHVAAAEEATFEDHDRHGQALAHLGRYSEAARSWSRAASMNSPGAIGARYRARLAEMAGTLGGLPSLAPDDRPWSELGRDELDAVLREQAESVRALREREQQDAAAGSKQRRKLREELRTIQGHFVSAGLEFSLRMEGLREAAFFGGYAPLILNPRSWRLGRAGETPEAAASGGIRIDPASVKAAAEAAEPGAKSERTKNKKKNNKKKKRGARSNG